MQTAAQIVHANHNTQAFMHPLGYYTTSDWTFFNDGDKHQPQLVSRAVHRLQLVWVSNPN